MTQEEVFSGRRDTGAGEKRIKDLEQSTTDHDNAITQNNADLATLNTVTLPQVQSDLSSAKSDIAGIQGLFPITSTSITDSAITTPKIAANAVTADKIVANSITGAKIVGLTITGDKIAANSISADKIVANSIGTGQLTATAIDGTTITGATIQTQSSGDRLTITGTSPGALQWTYGAGTITVAPATSSSLNVNAGLSVQGTVTTQAISNSGTTSLGGALSFTGGNSISFNTPGTISNCGTINGGPTINGDPTWTNSGTGGTANVNWNNGKLQQVSSSRRFKTDIADYQVDVEAALRLQPVTYLRDGVPEVGVIAEQAAEVGLEPWVERDADGEVFGFDYFKWTVALQAICQRQQSQIDDLSARLAALEAKAA